MGEEVFRQRGLHRADIYNGKNKKKRYAFAGWMEGVAKEIEALAPGRIAVVVDNPARSPEHVNVEFLKEGDVMRGLVTDAEVLDIIDDFLTTRNTPKFSFC